MWRTGNDSLLKKILRSADAYNAVYIEIVRYGSLFLDRLLNEGNLSLSPWQYSLFLVQIKLLYALYDIDI